MEYKYKTLGIIGGMGPAAGVRLQERIVRFTAVESDQEHLRMLAYTQPCIPDRTSYLLGKPGAESFIEPLQKSLRMLEHGGCDILAIACNTSHARYDELAGVLSKARLLNMLDETSRFMEHLGCSSVGVLATDGTLSTGVYERALSEHDTACVVPHDSTQRKVMDIIYNGVKAGRDVDPDELEECCIDLVKQGVDGIVLGCTELSCIPFSPLVEGIPVVDSLDVLAWRCVVECGAPAVDFPAVFADELSRRNR